MHFTQAAAKDRKILGENIYQPPIDGAPTGDDTIRQVFLLVEAEIGGAMSDERIHLTK